jgi:hypothetical protein
MTASLWSLLRGRGYFWHRTSSAVLGSILRDGEIVQNTGQFLPTYPQSEGSYARYIGAVSLFDFDTASEAEFETHRHDYWHGDVFIRIRRDALDPTMLNRAEDIWTDPRLDTLSNEDKHKLVCIPYLEVLHTGSILETAFEGFIFAPENGGDYCWHETTSDAAGLRELLEIATKRKAEEERERAGRHARGEYTHAELVEASYNIKHGTVPPVEGSGSS